MTLTPSQLNELQQRMSNLSYLGDDVLVIPKGTAKALISEARKAQKYATALKYICHYIPKDGETDADLAMRHIAREALAEGEGEV